jgi:hypothetical protein
MAHLAGHSETGQDFLSFLFQFSVSGTTKANLKRSEARQTGFWPNGLDLRRLMVFLTDLKKPPSLDPFLEARRGGRAARRQNPGQDQVGGFSPPPRPSTSSNSSYMSAAKNTILIHDI